MREMEWCVTSKGGSSSSNSSTHYTTSSSSSNNNSSGIYIGVACGQQRHLGGSPSGEMPHWRARATPPETPVAPHLAQARAPAT